MESDTSTRGIIDDTKTTDRREGLRDESELSRGSPVSDQAGGSSLAQQELDDVFKLFREKFPEACDAQTPEEAGLSGGAEDYPCYNHE